MPDQKPTLDYATPTPRRKKSPLVYIVATICSIFVFTFFVVLVGGISELDRVSDVARLLPMGIALALAVYTFLAVVKSST